MGKKTEALFDRWMMMNINEPACFSIDKQKFFKVTIVGFGKRDICKIRAEEEFELSRENNLFAKKGDLINAPLFHLYPPGMTKEILALHVHC